MACNHSEIDVMRYIDGEMSSEERETFKKHLETCDRCKNLLNEMSSLKEVTDSMKIADLPEAVWEKYWSDIYNRIERSVAWFLFILGSLILTGYSVYNMIRDPSLRNLMGLGVLLVVLGLAILFLSVLREKIAVNKADRYISEVKR